MRHAISKIFQNLNVYMLFVLFASFIFMTLSFEQQLSFDKINNLDKQKKIASKIASLQTDDLELALIQINGNLAQLKSDINKLKDIYKYNISEKYILNNEEEYFAQLSKLNQLIDIFVNNARFYYTNVKDTQKVQESKDTLQTSFEILNQHIDSIMLKDVDYNQEKFDIFKYFSVFSFIAIFMATIWYRKKLHNIYSDILHLVSVENNKETYRIYTQEMDAISLRMRRKVVATDNPILMDQVTGINNYKGLVQGYADKKDMKDSFFTAVVILEIDNFSKSKRTYSQELTQAILKKIAFTISLHEKATDVIARTDYNQFTLILSRVSKEQAFKDADIVKQSIGELNFNTPDNASITTTGGFIIKPNNTNLEEALRQAKEILAAAKKIGNNKVLQTINMATHSL
ncbi:MAG: GGDEF domain-containing protein [Sulfurimonas sp.]